jgi:hydrogenase nickel incorporation protein HypA/HybF
VNSPTIEVWGVFGVPATIQRLTGLFQKDRHKMLRRVSWVVIKMHEMSLMSEIIQIVSEDAVARGFKKVDKIDLIVGDLSNVLPDALELAFIFFQRQEDSIIDADAKLHIIREAAKARCQTCDCEFNPDYKIALCPRCNLPGSLLVSGETFRVESYEGSEEYDEN